MRAHEIDLITLIQGEKQFRVPLYQRPYSWTDKQLEQLWDDVVTEAARAPEDSDGSGHFIGSIVLAPSPTLHAGGLQKWLVVDGQQRLTTLMLFLAALRDHLQSADPQAAKRITNQYLINEYQSGDNRLRVLPTQADRTPFAACMLGQPGADAGETVGRAYRFFRAAVAEADDADDPHDLDRIESVIRNRLRLVEITTEQGDNVHRIFESLNNTGLKLSQADLLRNHLFMQLESKAEDAYRDIWLPMQQRVGQNNLELLMWLDLLLRGDEKAKQSQVYLDQLADLQRQGVDSEDRVIERMGEYARRSEHLAVLLDPPRERDSAVRDGLTRLSEWGGQTAFPIAMLLLEMRSASTLTPNEVAHGLRLLESFMVRRMVVGVRTNNLNRVMNSGPRELRDSEDAIAALHRYLSGVRRYWPSDRMLREAVLSKPFYWHGRGAQKVFVLRRLEESYGSPEPVDWVKAELTIEHVLPQTLNPEWSEVLLPDARTAGMTVDELHETMVHTLGNLTLTARNAALSNHPFQRKQDILKFSVLAMNQAIAKTDPWGREQILHRAEDLCQRMMKIWPGPQRTIADDPDKYDWSPMHRALALMPPGTWTTYGDLAELIGSHPVPVGVHVATPGVPNAWRVLTSDGQSSSGFHWHDPARTESQRDVLETEGVNFDEAGRANASCRLNARDLASLIGLDVADELPSILGDIDNVALWPRFRAQANEGLGEALAAQIEALLESWRRLGGAVQFGSATETSAFLILRFPAQLSPEIWPLVIYPQSGNIEVPFYWMARRPPFDDIANRKQLLQRLNAISGIVVPEAKVSMRPSFRISVLNQPEAFSQLCGTLEWFVITNRAACTNHTED